MVLKNKHVKYFWL